MANTGPADHNAFHDRPPPPPGRFYLKTQEEIEAEKQAEEDKKAQVRAAGKEIAGLAEQHLYTRFRSMKEAFKFLDLDNSGTVDAQEFARALRLWNIPIEDGKLEGLIQMCDENGDGQISYNEFVDVLARETVMMDAMKKRGMQSKEAMGVDAYAMIDHQMGRTKIKNEKYVSAHEKFKKSAFYAEGRDDVDDD